MWADHGRPNHLISRLGLRASDIGSPSGKRRGAGDRVQLHGQ